ncbi:uncharacterized protein [Littorina saxatilis]|uniref:uncharacterized protein n=1 Tax=Littorina saxatilis TaxID=31220 RepID=UPI0038B6A766
MSIDNFNTSCCHCHQACINCSSAGEDNCYACAEGHERQSSPTGPCVERPQADASVSSDANLLIGLTAGVVLSLAASLLSFAYCLRFYKKYARCVAREPKALLQSSNSTDIYSESRTTTISSQGSLTVAVRDDLPFTASENVCPSCSVDRPQFHEGETESASIPSILFDDGSDAETMMQTRPDAHFRRFTVNADVNRASSHSLAVNNPSSVSGLYDSSFNSVSLSTNSFGTDKTSQTGYSLNLDKLQENNRTSFPNTIGSFESIASTQTEYLDSSVNVAPMFSDTWQVREEFNSSGGFFRGPESDVRLEIPAGAVEDNLHVLIKGAVCTDLEHVHRSFRLPENEYIASVVAEYFAGDGFQFQKHVRIVLPHFLPPTFCKEKVKVYQCYVTASGDWVQQILPLEEKDNARRSSLKNEQLQREAVFYFAEKNEIHILTTHFSVYFCTDCGTDYPPPELFLEVHGRHSHQQVDMRLYIWDSRLNIEDFRKDLKDRGSENYRGMNLIDTKKLGALTHTDLGFPHVQVRAFLDLKNPEEWMHASRRGSVVFPSEQHLDLEEFVHCACRRGRVPQRIDWQVVSTPDRRPSDPCECYVDAHYVIDGRVVDNPRKVTIFVSVSRKPEEDQKSQHGQGLPRQADIRGRTYNNLSAAGENPALTYPKQVFSSFTPPPHLMSREDYRAVGEADSRTAETAGLQRTLSVGSCKNLYITSVGENFALPSRRPSTADAGVSYLNVPAETGLTSSVMGEQMYRHRDFDTAAVGTRRDAAVSQNPPSNISTEYLQSHSGYLNTAVESSRENMGLHLTQSPSEGSIHRYRDESDVAPGCSGAVSVDVERQTDSSESNPSTVEQIEENAWNDTCTFRLGLPVSEENCTSLVKETLV